MLSIGGRFLTATIAVAAATACGGAGTDDPKDSTAGETLASTTASAITTAVTPAETVGSPVATTTTSVPDVPALTIESDVVQINWSAVANPFFEAPSEVDDDPHYLIHTRPRDDGFYFALELYTTGYGARWTGELGPTELGCAEPPPGPSSTGICIQFDPDGEGLLPPLDGFTATGALEIHRLDAAGYDISLGSVTFSDGTVIEAFRLQG